MTARGIWREWELREPNQTPFASVVPDAITRTCRPSSPPRTYRYVDAVKRVAASVVNGTPSRETGRRGAHIVAVCNAIETAAETGDPVDIAAHGATEDPVTDPIVAVPDRDQRPRSVESLRLPPVDIGCSRYRDGEYVDRKDSIVTALDTATACWIARSSTATNAGSERC